MANLFSLMAISVDSDIFRDEISTVENVPLVEMAKN